MIELKRLALPLVLAVAGPVLFAGSAGADRAAPERAAFEDRGRMIEPGPGPARGKEGFCRAYADRAVSAEETNQELECGFTGAAWHQRRNSHYHWCLNTPQARVREETRMRRERLEQCRSAEEEVDNGFCQAYARRAANAQLINEELGCGFGGPRWTSDREAHYDWCRNVPRSRAERESEARRNQLQRCRRYP